MFDLLDEFSDTGAVTVLHYRKRWSTLTNIPHICTGGPSSSSHGDFGEFDRTQL